MCVLFSIFSKVLLQALFFQTLVWLLCGGRQEGGQLCVRWCVEFSFALGFPYLPRNVPVLAGYHVGVMGTGDASWPLSALMAEVPLRFSPLSLSHMRSCLRSKGQES